MKLSVDFRRWKTKAALAVAGALAIGGALGSAVAMSPIVQPPIKWAGGAEFVATLGGLSTQKVYTVPAGKNFLLTDLVVSNASANDNHFLVHTSVHPTLCTPTHFVTRIGATHFKSGQHTLVLAFQTGISFSAGQHVCIGALGGLEVTGRGFLFTAAPAS